MNIEELKDLFEVKSVVDKEYFRIGSKNDGGYINVKDISDNDFSISFGISYNVDWEIDFMKYGHGIDCYDNSINSLPENIKNSRFFNTTIGKDLFLKDCIDRCPENKDLILKMDIEGGEWDVLKHATTQEISKFRQIVVEYHWLFSAFTDGDFYKNMKECINKINITHVPVWIHANNYGKSDTILGKTIADVVEVLYLRKDSYEFEKYKDVFTNMNMPNNAELPEVLLDFYND